MSEGTSLEDIENGSIANQADSAVMNAILTDMNALPEEPVMSPPPPPPSMQIQEFPTQPQYSAYTEPFPSHPMMQQQQQFQQQPMFDMYTPIAPDMPPQIPIAVASTQAVSPQNTKQNAWSDVCVSIMDGLLVALIVGVLSLPVLHTRFASYASWAYKVGGELSWTGLVTLSVLGGLCFTVLRWITTQAKIVDFVGSL